MNNLLSIKNLNKHFDGIKAVNSCSFDIEKGKITALIGPNGSGKSTVFNLISGILHPDSGEIKFDASIITDMKTHQIARLGISRVFQQSRLFSNLSVKENLSLALFPDNLNLITSGTPSKLQNKKIKDILDKFNLTKYINTETKELSFAQKRLVELSRAYLKPHQLLLLDEPIAGVNPTLRDEIKHFLLEQKNQEQAILIIEHDMNFVLNLADHLIVMDAGRVIASGPPDTIKNNQQVINAYLGV